jgi:cytochrome c-type biogenesis protein
MSDTWQLWLYQLETLSTEWVKVQLQHLSLFSLVIVWLAGLLTSLSPCTLSMLPITVGYIGGYAERRSQALQQSLAFATGVALTLTGLGVTAALLGRIYGQVGWIWSVLVGVIAIVMGLNLLQVLPLRFPDPVARLEIPTQLPPLLRSFLVGLTFGLVASPCSTPVLIALLGWVSTTGQPWLGSALLFVYAAGLVTPLVLAGLFTVLIKQLLTVRRWSRWITYASGLVLVAFGSLSILARIA